MQMFMVSRGLNLMTQSSHLSFNDFWFRVKH